VLFLLLICYSVVNFYFLLLIVLFLLICYSVVNLLLLFFIFVLLLTVLFCC